MLYRMLIRASFVIFNVASASTHNANQMSQLAYHSLPLVSTKVGLMLFGSGETDEPGIGEGD